MTTKTNYHLRVAAIVAVAVLAAGLLVLLAPMKPAEAAFPGENGKVVFQDQNTISNPQSMEIYAIDPSDTSGTRRNLTNNTADEYAPAVSPDGSKIAFVRDLGFSQGGYAIYTMNSNGSNKTPIETGVKVDFNRSTPESIRPAFSSDGSKIAFADARDGDADIYLINSDGSGTLTNLTNNTSFDAHPAFSPVDANKMIFSSDRSGNMGQSNLHLMDVSDPDTPATNLTNSQYSEFWSSFSPNGDKVAFARYTNTLDIYVVNADGSGTPTNLTPTDDSPFGTDDSHPAFSPGGDKIAFAKIVRGGDWELYTMNAEDGSGQTPLTRVLTTFIPLDWGIKVTETDPTPPETGITDGPNGLTNDTTPTFSFSGTDDVSAPESLLYSYKVDGGAWSDPDSSTTATLGGETGFSDGSTHNFYVKAIDEAGNEDESPAEQSFTVDTTPPSVTSVTPENSINVLKTANVEVTFSETMKASTLTSDTIKLEKVGARNSLTIVPTLLSFDDPDKPTKVTLDPDPKDLERGAAYKVTITTEVQDEAGNRLLEQRVAYFKVGGK